MRVPGGGAPCLGVGRPGLGALPPPTARPLGGLPGPTTHWLWVRGGAGVGTRHQPHSAGSCELALPAVGAARRRPGGGRLLLGCGASGVGRSPTPDCPPSGRAAGAHYSLALGVGCERGDHDDDARGEPATPSTPSATTQGGTQCPAGPDCLGGPGSQKRAPGTQSPRPTHAVHDEHRRPTTHDHANYDPGTAGTTGPLGGETIQGGAKRRQLEPERDQTP